MKKIFFILCIFFFSVIILKAQNELYQKKEYIFKNDTLRYRILYPENYDSSKSYPLVLFLHGSGERGNDNEKQLIHGSSLFTNPENRTKFPAIVVFPQCPENQYWAPVGSHANGFSYVNTKKPTEPMQMVIRLIKELKKNEAVDKKRIYVSGLSMGGMGTYDLICRYPKTFAAAIPICGGVSLDRLKKVKRMPIRIYHGSADNVVSPEHSQNAYTELKANGSQTVELIVFPGVEHNSWDDAFAQPDFLGWMFSKKLK
ncbi:MAG: prolyl oligopeptidase family serine peptidase [Bacteroidales bacterium]|nr:prolyl oligopeptidase family serine peptidase [Bacteroidales bacterium]